QAGNRVVQCDEQPGDAHGSFAELPHVVVSATLERSAAATRSDRHSGEVVTSERAGLRARPRQREPTSRAPKRARARVTWLVSSLIVAGLAAYSNSLAAPFVFDDHGSIVENAYIRQLWPLGNALSAPVQSAVAGRPVVSLSLAINYALTGLSPAGFRGWNLAVHLLTALLLFGVVRRTLTAPLLKAR